MALENKIEKVADFVEAAKNFFVDLFRPDMTLEKISDVVSPRLDDTIKKYEARGLEYSAGKFSIKYADEKHFQLEFEMYFRDEEGKWHKCANESDLRDYTLLEAGAWKTIQALKVITFPIEKPKTAGGEVLQKDNNLEEYREALTAPADTIDLEKPAQPAAESVTAAETEKK
ncbi:MAG: hypothetical protein IJR52_05290 [Selenomonadaceae bacterium]|nr:hypothetical protein [Selenomonadaceae bacterium]MBQ9496976.1 hypothetical protein [Selenomonadaceae bacterium]